MKTILIILTHLILFGSALAQTTKVVYTCPMHADVQVEKPGNCPKCGMTLIKKTIKDTKSNTHKKEEPNQKPNDISGHEGHNKEETISKTNAGGLVDMMAGRTVVYHLYITDTMVNYTGKSKHAYAINGTIPGPELVFTEGDTAEIYLHNMLKDEKTSLHWHGVILPNQFDGVPYLTTAPIHAGNVHLYKFAIVQNGTYWYHSHSKLQEQAGIYGALIFKKRQGQNIVSEQISPSDPMKGHEGHDIRTMDRDQKDGPHQNDTGSQQEHRKNMEPKKNKQDMESTDHSGMNHAGDHSSATNIPLTGNGAFNAEQTVVLSEWTDEDPNQVQRRLRTANDWYAIKKGSVQSYSEAIKAGHFKTKLINEWKRMNAMDVSDVYYNRFLINGQPVAENTSFKAGDRVRLRVVNAGASSYFWLGYGGGKMTVIANDGNDVDPVEVDRLIVGVSETYDVVVTITENKSYEFRATPEDRTMAASLWLGSGEKVSAPKLPRLKYFEGMKMMNEMMKMNGDMKSMGMKMSLQQMDMNAVMYDELTNTPMSDHSQHKMQTPENPDSSQAHNMTQMQGMDTGNDGIITLNYSMLRSPAKTILPDVATKELFFTLTGNMNRYVWSINNKILREWDKILIEKGQNVRIILFNNSMMRHPMHLHGHDFRVLNKQGEYSPFKNVLDIMPMETDTIEFAANQSGDWFFHCHILYHMMAGMGNVFSYKDSPVKPELPNATASYNKFLRGERMMHPMAEIGLESNGSDGRIMLSEARFELRSEWRIGIKPMHGYESETYFGRYLGKMQWLFPFVGFDYHQNDRENELTKNAFGQFSNQSNRKALVAGFEYTLPMHVVAQARVDSKGKFRFQLGREDMPLSTRLRLNMMVNTDKEYMAGFRYILRKWLALSTHYDSDMGLGAGITLIY